MGNTGQPCSAIGQYQAPLIVRQRRFPNGLAQVMPSSPGPSMNQQEQPPTAQQEGTRVNTQRRSEETRKNFSSRHADHTINTHEQAWNNDTSIQEAKEATGTTIGQQ